MDKGKVILKSIIQLSLKLIDILKMPAKNSIFLPLKAIIIKIEKLIYNRLSSN
jgi:hypothetical protein